MATFDSTSFQDRMEILNTLLIGMGIGLVLGVLGMILFTADKADEYPFLGLLPAGLVVMDLGRYAGCGRRLAADEWVVRVLPDDLHLARPSQVVRTCSGPRRVFSGNPR